MKMHEYNWQSEDGTSFYAWSSVMGNPRGLILLIHGFGDHSHRYEHVAEWMNNHGYGFMAIDLWGHGRSDGKKGDIPSFRLLLQSVETLVQQAGSLFPGIPQVLYGHSLGGNVVLNYCLSAETKPAAMVVTSPWLQLAFKPSPALRFISNLFLRFAPGTLIRNPLNSAHLSRNPQIGIDYVNDPFVHRKVTPRVPVIIEEMGKNVINKSKEITIPVLLMHGTGDMITSHEASHELADKNRDFITFRLWPGGYHELHNESEQAEVLSCITDWLNNKLPS